MQKITSSTYVETGFKGCNCGFVATSDGVVLIDTPMLPADAVAWRHEADTYGPIRYIINTEPHVDHFSGNAFFDAPIIAHDGTRQAVLHADMERFLEILQAAPEKNMTLMDGYAFRPPDITFSERMALHVGDHEFRLVHMPGHSPFQIAVTVVSERVVFTSDNIFYRLQPAMHEALPFEWLNALDQLEKLNVDILVPGHGKVCDKTYLPVMRDVLNDWIDAVSAAIEKGLTQEEALAAIQLPQRFDVSAEEEENYKRWKPMNIARLYEVLQKYALSGLRHHK